MESPDYLQESSATACSCSLLEVVGKAKSLVSLLEGVVMVSLEGVVIVSLKGVVMVSLLERLGKVEMWEMNSSSRKADIFLEMLIEECDLCSTCLMICF